ncbi:MAG: aspartate/glutamate racemase family protein [Pigmentiphaga sp.]|uniref:aspartate/glutamate racemase family protein n=1 Tax=Pigmentiphaga sp. TaxID=1977564 RepID=UPI0029B19611|nr:aspartate/glutamate racemase family protein [Pigmentiphaga sp.]MDX3906729.1 aspartate/glutamate racemase family protein [Pigmentiphaga sp.]
MVAARKKTFHGVTVGILMVKTGFCRLPGDVGHAGTWDFPVQYRIVEQATPDKMMALEESGLLDAFKDAARELVAGGVDGIATTCGFLALYQRELAAACGVPVASSSLLQAPWAERLLPPGKRVGILTFSRESLHAAHLEAVGVDAGTPVVGMPADSMFVTAIKSGDTVPRFEPMRTEVLDAAARLLRDYPDVGAIVSECSNMTPFSADIAERFGVPVYDGVTLINWFHAGLRPRRYPQA